MHIHSSIVSIPEHDLVDALVMDHAPITSGSAGGSLKRLATEVIQSPELTRWIGQLSLNDAG